MIERAAPPGRALARWLALATPYRTANFLVPIAITYVIGARFGYATASGLAALVPLGEVGALGLLAIPFLARTSLPWRLGLMTVAAALLASVTVGAPLAIGAIGALGVGSAATLVTGELRRNLTDRLDPIDRGRAFAIDSVAQELTWLAAPLLATVLVVAGLRSSLLTLVALAGAVATVGALRSRATPHTDQRALPRRARRAGALWTLSALEGVLEGGAVLIAVPLAAHWLGSSPLGGVALSAMSIGSIVSGIVFTRVWSHRPARATTLAALVLCLGIALAAWGIAAPVAWLWLAASVTAGITIAPINALRVGLVPTTFASNELTSAFSVLYASYSIGWTAAGLAAAVLLPRVGARELTLLLASVGVAFACLVWLHARRASPARRPSHTPTS